MSKHESKNEALVVVHTSDNPAVLPVIESLLSEAGIRFLVKGEGIQSLFGGGLFGGTNIAAGPVQILVLPKDEAAARELLANASSGTHDVRS